jgi:hypothetical protein
MARLESSCVTGTSRSNHPLRHLGALALLAGAAAVLPTSTADAATLLLEYKFDGTGTTEGSSGGNATAVTLRNSSNNPVDLRTAGTASAQRIDGVSGLAGDRAFDNNASTGMGSNFSPPDEVGGRADQADLAVIDGLTSFTLSGWFRSATPIGGFAKLIHNMDESGTKKGFQLTADAGQLILEVDDSGALSSAASFADTNAWVFFAVTYNDVAAGADVQFYKGTVGGPVGSVALKAGLTGEINKGAADDENFGLAIGNRSATFDRPYDGLLDNIRIHSGVLTISELEGYRAADIVPEPSSLGLLGIGAIGLLARRRRQA